MIKITEESIIGIGLINGIDAAMRKFDKINNVSYDMKNPDPFALFYRDFSDLTDSKSLYEGEIEVFSLPKNIDLKLLDILLTLIKKETYTLGLRILRKENLLYIYIDNVINKDSYYVDDENIITNIKINLGRKY